MKLLKFCIAFVFIAQCTVAQIEKVELTDLSFLKMQMKLGNYYDNSLNEIDIEPQKYATTAEPAAELSFSRTRSYKNILVRDQFHYDFEFSLAPLLPQDEDESVSNDIYYFIGAAVLASVVYFAWPDEDNSETDLTFGKPSTP